jgi:RNA polymerase sigma factor (sigma-70 family)
MSDYRLEFKVRNGRFLKALEAAGFNSACHLCRVHDIDYSMVASILSFKRAPIDKMGVWRKSVMQVCEALGLLPEDLFSPAQRTMELKTNTGVRDVAEPALLRLMGQTQQLEWDLAGAGDPLAALERGQERASFDELLDAVSTNLARIQSDEPGIRMNRREREVLRMRYQDELTLDQCAAALNVTRERVRQIEARALRSLRSAVDWQRVTGFEMPKLKLLPGPALDDEPEGA